jgi:twinkle protein
MSRHHQSGYFSLADLPQRASLAECVFGTGWPDLDRIFKFYHGQFTVVTGKPGHGKSTFLLNVVCNIARDHGTRTFLYCPENERAIYDKLRKIWNNDGSFNYFAEQQCYVQSSKTDGYDTAPRTLDWVLDHAVTAIEHDHVELVVIDPWNWLERCKPRDQMLTDYIGDCLALIKNFCAHFEVALVMVAHPTKAVNEGGGRTATLADIEGSMSWWNKCDNGLIVTREIESSTAKIISAKVREEPDAGRPGFQRFFVEADSGIFSPLTGTAGNEYDPPARRNFGDPSRPRNQTAQPGADHDGGRRHNGPDPADNFR